MAHLDEEQLLRFTLGTLEASIAAEAEAHVLVCDECRLKQKGLAVEVFATTVAAPMVKGNPTQPDRPTAKATSTGALTRGTTLGRYVLLERLGTGGMGEVFAAFDPQLDRKVALKLLRGGATSAAEGKARLLREAQAMARLQHPNVVAVHDVGTFDDRVFIAMEFIDGETLSDWLRGDRQWREVVRLFLQAGSGLAAAHHAGLIHRDFKPDNVLIGSDGRPRVLDFGLARQATSTPVPVSSTPTPTRLPDVPWKTGVTLDESTGARAPENAVQPEPPSGVSKASHSPSSDSSLAAKLTLDGAVMGTPGYMAPEQLAGLPTDGRCDQFAFSVALYEALFGKRPFGGSTLQQHAAEINQGRVPPPPPNSPVPDYLFGVVKRGLAANPADRYPDMDALLVALRPRRRRSWRTIGTIAALSVLAVLGVGYALWSAQRLRVCGGSEQNLVDVWDGPTKQKLRAAFDKTGSAFAADAWKNAAKTLDAWALNWVNASREACESARLRKVDSPALYEMKRTCLDGRLQRLRALSHLFEEADRDVVAHASAAAASLDPVSGCFDLEALTRLPVLDARTQAAELRLQTQLAEARALFDAGKYARGVDVLRSAVTADSPARDQAEGFLWLGRLMLKSGSVSEAHAANVQAAEQAVRAGDAALQAIAFSRLYGNEGFDDDDESADDTESWSRLAHAAASRVPLDWEVQYELALNDALVSLRGRHLAEALAQFERALALVEEHRGPSHPDVASMHDNLGVTFSAAGDFAAAIEQFDQSYALHVALEGREHPSTALAEGNLAFALRSVGRFHEAIEHYEHSLSVRRITLGETHPETLKSYDSLAKAYLAADRRDEALALLQRTLDVRTQLNGAESREVGLTLDALVEVFKAGGYWREAHDYALRELAIMRKVSGVESLSVATALVTMGGLDTHLGNWNEARSHLLEAQRIRRLKLGETSAEVAAVSDSMGELALAMGSGADAFDQYRRALALHEKGSNAAAISTDLVGLGRAAMLLGQPLLAVQALERALSLHSKSEDPKALSTVKLELGRALWLSGVDFQPRAKTLLHEALAAMVEPARGEAQAALAKRGIVIEVVDTADAGAGAGREAAP